VERQQELWEQFVDAYTATETRPAADVFLRAILGEPKKEQS
jgi:hypothetical protein